MVTDRIEQLNKTSRVFQLLDEQGRDRMQRVATELHYRAGDVLIRQGEAGDSFYAILAGTVAVTAEDYGEQRPVAVLEPGSVFGEIAALTREPRTATLTAISEVSVLRFEMVGVFNVLKDYPAALAELNRLGVTRSEDLLEKMSD